MKGNKIYIYLNTFAKSYLILLEYFFQRTSCGQESNDYRVQLEYNYYHIVKIKRNQCIPKNGCKKLTKHKLFPGDTTKSGANGGNKLAVAIVCGL